MKLRHAALVLASVSSLLLAYPQAQAQATYKEIGLDCGGRFLGFCTTNVPGRIYGYGDVFGTWRSDNYGATWQPLQNGFQKFDNFIAAMGVQGTNADIVGFVTNNAGGDTTKQSGFYGSSDGGATWTKLIAVMSGDAPYGSTQLINDPTGVAGTQDDWILIRKRPNLTGMLWRSTNGLSGNEADWVKLGGSTFDGTIKAKTVYMHKDYPNQIWVGAEDTSGGTGGGLYVSIDNGASFTQVWGAAPVNPGGRLAVVDSIVRRSRAQGGEGFIGSNIAGVLITSTNNWGTPSTTTYSGANVVNRDNGQGVTGVAVLPTGEFISGQDALTSIIKMSDTTPSPTEVTWSVVRGVLDPTGPTPSYRKPVAANDYTTKIPAYRSMITIDPTNSARWYTTGGKSPFISENSGDTWKYPPIGNGLAAVNCYSVGFFPSAGSASVAKKAFIAGADQGIFTIDDGGASGNPAFCSRVRLFNSDGTASTEDPHHTYHDVMTSKDGNTVVAAGVDQSASRSRIIRSTNGGQDWTLITLPTNVPETYHGIVRASANPDDIRDFLVVLGYGTDGKTGQPSNPGLWRTKDGGTTFEATNINLTGIDTGGRTNFLGNTWISRAPDRPNTVYMSIRGGTTATPAGFWKSTDGGTNWTRGNQPFTSHTITGIAVDPTKVGRVWVVGDSTHNGGSNKFYKSDDYGANWVLASSYFTGFNVARVTATNGKVAVWAKPPSTASNFDDGFRLYYSADDGANWAEQTSGNMQTPNSHRYGHMTNINLDPYRIGKIWISGLTSVHLVDAAPEADPVISSALTASGTAGSSFTYTITATSSPAATMSYYAEGLPPGVTLDSATGVISGTPTTEGTYNVTIYAVGAHRTSVAKTLVLTVAAAPAPVPVTSDLIIRESFAYTVGTNSPDPDGGLNSGNGLPVTNQGGTPSGTSTGLRGTWGTTNDVVTGLAYVQGTKTLVTAGGAARVNNATWGNSAPWVYRNMSTDPFVAQRVGSSTGGNFGVSGNSLYVSFLAQTSSSTANAFRMNFSYTSGSYNFYVSNTTTGWSLHGTTATGASLALNTPTLMLMKFEFGTTGTANTTVKLWVNPPLGSTASTLGTPNAVKTGVRFDGLGNFGTHAAVANAMTFDELRVGTTVESVTPHSTSGGGDTAITLSNAGFESDQSQTPAGWLSSATNSAHLDADYAEAWMPRSGTSHLSHWLGNSPYQVYTYRTVTGLTNGTYTVKAWTMSSGGLTSAKMIAKNYGGSEVFTSIPTGGTYTERSISNISVTNGQLELGFYSDSPGGADQWIAVDDVTLTRN
jgi:hypothetical protein